MKRGPAYFALLTVFSCLIAPGPAAAGDSGAAGIAQSLLRSTGTRGGLVVHLGCDTGELTAALGASESYLVHGLDSSEAEVARARNHISARGSYGQVSVEHWTANRLPYANNLVNLLLVEDPGGVSMQEMMRVLAPRGTVCVKEAGKWTKRTKPWPREMDQWTHYMHDADNNAVSADMLVGKPRSLQWNGAPTWGRTHDPWSYYSPISAMVSSGGRIFYFVDLGPRFSVALPSRRYLIARDAFSGVVLWRRRIPSWENPVRRWQGLPLQAPRRLVAVADRVYASFPDGGPVVVLDAATGEEIDRLEGSENAKELRVAEDKLFALIGRTEETAPVVPDEGNDSFNPRVLLEMADRHVRAYDADTGDPAWNLSGENLGDVVLGTLTVGDGRVFFLTKDQMMCLDADAGGELWTRERNLQQRNKATPPNVVAYKDVLLCGYPRGKLYAYSADSGEELWQSDYHTNVGTAGPLLVVNDVVWTGALGQTRMPGIIKGLDFRTGEVGVRRPPDKDFMKLRHHHRCYKSKATPRYLMTSRMGIEFIDVSSGDAEPHNWVRGGCSYGIMPANGLIYTPPHACTCYNHKMVHGLHALASAEFRGDEPVESPENTLEKGPAYGESTSSDAAAGAEDWPTFRHDSARSGAAGTSVSSRPKRRWSSKIGGKLTPPTIARGTVFVASVDAHTVYALDEKMGGKLWKFVADGRIDTPPTCYRGLVIFGCADGSVYCLGADDGELRWRFRAAPAARRVVSYGRLESAWPVHGSVLVTDGRVYCVAGRTAPMDEGLYLYALDPETGEVLASHQIQEETRAQIMSSDGEHIFMREQVLNEDLQPQKADVPHLIPGYGYRDDSWMHRSYWLFGTSIGDHWGGWPRPPQRRPAGHILVTDGEKFYGYGKHSYNPQGSHIGFYPPVGSHFILFACDRDPESRVVKMKRLNGTTYKQRRVKHLWTRRPGVMARAMTLAKDCLFIAGPPHYPSEQKIAGRYGDAEYEEWLRKESAAFAGKEGGRLMAVSPEDGSALSETNLHALPVFDGMAAANGSLFLSLKDGTLVCLD